MCKNPLIIVGKNIPIFYFFANTINRSSRVKFLKGILYRGMRLVNFFVLKKNTKFSCTSLDTPHFVWHSGRALDGDCAGGILGTESQILINTQQSVTRGSALIMVLFMMTALMLYCATIWHATTYVAESVHARVAGEYQHQLVRAVHSWGVTFSKKYYQELLKQPRVVELVLQPQATKTEKIYHARVRLVPAETEVRVETELTMPSKKILKKSCVLTQKMVDKKPVFLITT